MQKIFVSYKLKPGVTIEQYESWSKDIDQRITPGQPGFIRYEIYKIEGADKGEPFCQIVEDIEVESFEKFTETVNGPGMKYVMETFRNIIDISTMQTVYGTKIVPALHPDGARPPLPA